MVSELGGAQISTLLESLPGIANVLRSPVADALVSVIRAGARLSEFDIADADELVKYATRRGLLAEDEGERLMTELAGRPPEEARPHRRAPHASPPRARRRRSPSRSRRPRPHKPKAHAAKKPAAKKKKH